MTTSEDSKLSSGVALIAGLVLLLRLDLDFLTVPSCAIEEKVESQTGRSGEPIRLWFNLLPKSATIKEARVREGHHKHFISFSFLQNVRNDYARCVS